MHPDDQTPAGPPRTLRPRWGLRTLGFLGLAFLAVFVSLSLGGHTFGTLGSLVVGLAGAGYCTVKGVRQLRDDGGIDLLTGRRRPR